MSSADTARSASEFPEQSTHTSTLIAVASNTANTDTSIDLCMRSMLVQVKRPRRCTDLERVVRRHLAQLAAISDSAFLDHANLRILARTLVADKGSSGWWNADAPSFSLDRKSVV